MRTQISVRSTGEHSYGVVVTEGVDTTAHAVSVPDDLADDLGLVDVDEERLVRESVHFLLDREPADAIAAEVDLGDVRRRFPDYVEEIVARLTP